MQYERLCRCPLSGVCSRDRGPFREVCRSQQHILYLEGEAIDRVYLLQQGSVSLHRMAGENDALGRTRAVRHAGSLLGIEALIHDVYQESARAETPLLLCVAGREEFMEWMGPRDGTSYRILETVLRSRTEEVLQQAAPDGTALQRVAHWLIDSDQLERHTRIPHKTISDLLGMRPETFSRALHELARRECIELSGASIVVLRADSLRELLPR